MLRLQITLRWKMLINLHPIFTASSDRMTFTICVPPKGENQCPNGARHQWATKQETRPRAIVQISRKGLNTERNTRMGALQFSEEPTWGCFMNRISLDTAYSSATTAVVTSIRPNDTAHCASSKKQIHW